MVVYQFVSNALRLKENAEAIGQEDIANMSEAYLRGLNKAELPYDIPNPAAFGVHADAVKAGVRLFRNALELVRSEKLGTEDARRLFRGYTEIGDTFPNEEFLGYKAEDEPKIVKLSRL